jgi:hypothetical protein
MPLLGTEELLATAIEGQLATELGPLFVPTADTHKTWRAVARALLIHVTANAVVTVPAGILVVGAPAAIGVPIAGATTTPGVGVIL